MATPSKTHPAMTTGLKSHPRRRCLLVSMGLLMAACRPSKSASDAELAEPLTPEQQYYLESRARMRQKFGDRGFELNVDAMRGEEFFGVNFYYEGTQIAFYGSGSQSLRNAATMATGHSIPERARIVWRDSGEWGEDAQQMPVYAGKIIGDEVIEVGTRIPQALLDDLKRDPKGGLRLKFRMSQQGTLLGWDIDRRPGYVPGRDMYVPAVYSHVGGDFREAQIENGKVVTKGWYIDKKTGEKIEIDF